jgi:hypothetical protein
MLHLETILKDLERIYSPRQINPWRNGTAAVHLALMHQPYFDDVVAEQKTIESRFSATRIPPIGCAQTGDLVIFKLVGKTTAAAAVVSCVVSGTLNRTTWKLIRAHKRAIGVDETYLATKTSARYVALLWLSHVCPIAPIDAKKRDRRAWIVLSHRHAQIPLL